MAMQTVEWDRSALLAPFVGAISFLIQRCTRYVQEREQFGRPIASFQGIKHRLADMKIFLEAAQSLVYRIAWCKDQGRPPNFEAAVAKLCGRLVTRPHKRRHVDIRRLWLLPRI